MVDASPDFIGVAGLDQRGVYVNPAGMELSGLEPSQVASISVLDFFPESERSRILGFIAGSDDGKHVVVDTYFQHLRTGQLVPVSWSFLKLRNASGNVSGYATVTRDLTERRRAEELLRASEERRRLALDAAELGTWHVEPATRATKTDARYRAIFGTTEDWTDYLQAFAVIHPDDLPAVKEAVATATRPEDPTPFAIEYRIVHPDGSLHWVLANGRSSFEGLGSTRRAVSFDGTVADITDRKRGEEEREQLVANLQEQDQRKDEFLATLAHELRNPLAPIRNGLQIMRLAKGDPEATEQVRSMMERQLGQMVHLIDDLLDLSRISRGKIELRKERIEAAPAAQPAMFGDAQWVKVYKTEQPGKVDLDQLVGDNHAVVPENAGQLEVNWSLLQNDPPAGGNQRRRGKLVNQGNLGNGNHAVVRRYEYYKYAGRYDPLTHEALCADLTCTVPAPGELGDAMAAQNVAANLDVNALSVAVAGAGAVSSADNVFGCGTKCYVVYAAGSNVSLTAKPNSGSVFAFWSGACAGNALTCTVLLNAESAVTANFTTLAGGGGGGGGAATFTLSVSKSNLGTVTSTPSGIDCGSSCTVKLVPGNALTLSATPPPGKTFVNWSGACVGTDPICSITMNADTKVQANFSK